MCDAPLHLYRSAPLLKRGVPQSYTIGVGHSYIGGVGHSYFAVVGKRCDRVWANEWNGLRQRQFPLSLIPSCLLFRSIIRGTMKDVNITSVRRICQMLFMRKRQLEKQKKTWENKRKQSGFSRVLATPNWRFFCFLLFFQLAEGIKSFWKISWTHVMTKTEIHPLVIDANVSPSHWWFVIVIFLANKFTEKITMPNHHPIGFCINPKAINRK